MGGMEEREGERESGRRGKREMPLTSKKGHLLVTFHCYMCIHLTLSSFANIPAQHIMACVYNHNLAGSHHYKHHCMD